MLQPPVEAGRFDHQGGGRKLQLVAAMPAVLGGGAALTLVKECLYMFEHDLGA